MLIINKTKQVEYKELKPRDVVVCGELVNNYPWFDCIVLVVDYENKWFKALTINQGIKNTHSTERFISLTKMMCKYGEELIVGDVVFGLLSPNNSNINNIGICVKIEQYDECYLAVWFLMEYEIQKKYILKWEVRQTI